MFCLWKCCCYARHTSKKKSSSSKTSAASTKIDSLSVQMKKSSLTMRILKVEIGNNWFRLYDRSSTIAKFVITSCRDRKSWKELLNKRHVFSFRQTRINNKRTTKYYILYPRCSLFLCPWPAMESIVDIARCISRIMLFNEFCEEKVKSCWIFKHNSSDNIPKGKAIARCPPASLAEYAAVIHQRSGKGLGWRNKWINFTSKNSLELFFYI